MRLIRALAYALALVLLLPALDARADRKPAEKKLIRLTQRARADRLDVRHGLIHQTRRHSRRMARRGFLFHSNTLRYSCGFIRAEVVGRASNARRVFRAFMRSSHHRRIILASFFSKMGWGVARRGGFLYATGVFCA